MFVDRELGGQMYCLHNAPPPNAFSSLRDTTGILADSCLVQVVEQDCGTTATKAAPEDVAKTVAEVVSESQI